MSWLKKGTKKIVSSDGYATETNWNSIEKWASELTEAEKQDLKSLLPKVKNNDGKNGS